MKTLSIKRFLAPLLTIALSSALFSFLYRFDNKYTHTATQAADGLLVISKEDIQDYPLRYLTHGWEFYPGVLLSPEDLNSDKPPPYMLYTMIGERTRFDFGDGNPHGSASYVMRLQLPQQKHTYALDLPEIFSSYHLFVNDKLMLTVGTPETNSYTALTGNRLITFEASGRTLILLAVSDESHFYSGLVYPPAFGMPEAVYSARDLRLWLRIIALSVAILAGLGSLYLGFRMNEQNSLLFALLCLAVCGFISYPILRTAFTLPVSPWYALELFSGYAVALLVVVLHNRLCDVAGTARTFSIGATATVCIAALLYGIFSSQLTVPVMKAFSVLVFVFKSAMAVYLLITSAFALKIRPEQGRILFCSTLVYAMAFVWDRILPLYEPVLGSWFSEIGSIALVSAVGYTLWQNIADAYASSISIAEEHRQISRQLTMQIEYARRLAEKSEENRRLVHDFRQHIRTIDGLVLAGGEPSLRSYLDMMTQVIDRADCSEGISFCTNAAVDALLGYYYSSARKMGIEMTVQLTISDRLPLTDVELCTMFGNLIENALDACGRISQGNRSIAISSLINGSTLFFLIENTYDGIVKTGGEWLLSRKSKEERLGIGLRSVREIVERHGGVLDILPQKSVFRVGICIPLS